MKHIALSPAAVGLLKQLHQAFINKFGREPGPTDPMFFDPDAEEPRPRPDEQIVNEVVKGMFAVGIDPAIIWAFIRTGLLVTEMNLPLLDPDDLKAWVDALNEYDAADHYRRQ